MKITQAMRAMAETIGVPQEDLENSRDAQRYVKTYLRKPKPYRETEPQDANGFSTLSVQTIGPKRLPQ